MDMFFQNIVVSYDKFCVFYYTVYRKIKYTMSLSYEKYTYLHAAPIWSHIIIITYSTRMPFIFYDRENSTNKKFLLSIFSLP